jgi:S1-C subfamily serine protease
MPVVTQWTLEAAGPTQRSSISSVFLLVCPATQSKGSSFLLASGFVVSNEHVVRGCDAATLFATTPQGRQIKFSKIVVDPDRDLAVLRPTERLTGGLTLAPEAPLKLGAGVTAWGFPLIYNGPAPLLSVGYVAGFNAVKLGNRTVRHIVVNGAFNPGNSGGPVFLANDDKVVGIVVWKLIAFSNDVPVIIESFRKPNVSLSSALVQTMPDGSTRSVSQQEAIAIVLEEFYRKVQVFIGEAISVSELRAFLAEKSADLQPFEPAHPGHLP